MGEGKDDQNLLYKIVFKIKRKDNKIIFKMILLMRKKLVQIFRCEDVSVKEDHKEMAQ